MAKAATPWGPAELVEELTLAQRAGEKRFSSVVQLLEAPGGERLVRFAYSTGGTARRGPVTLRGRDLERLRAGLAEAPGAGGGARAQAAVASRPLASGVHERAEQEGAVAGAEQRVDRVLRVRHQAEDVARRALTTPAMSATEPFGFVRVAEHDLAVASSSASSSSSAK